MMGIYVNGIELPKEPDEMIELAIFGDGKTLKTGESWRSPVDGKCYYGPSEDMNTYFAEELSKPQWIPVTERLPEFGVRALCKCRANIYEVLTWTAEGWKHDPQHIYMSGFVTHWMLFPEPQKEGE